MVWFVSTFEVSLNRGLNNFSMNHSNNLFKITFCWSIHHKRVVGFDQGNHRCWEVAFRVYTNVCAMANV